MEDLRKRAFDYIDEHSDDMAKFLSEMIRAKSVNQGDPDTGDEREIAAVVSKRFESLGLDTRIIFGDEAEIRPNVVGVLKGKGGGKNLLFNAHMDTVPVDDEEYWKYPPFSGTIADGRVWGRGANDDKNGIAAMTYAAEALKSVGAELSGDVILLASAGEESEEGKNYGAGKAVEKGGIKADLAVIGEESGMALLIDGVSLLFFEIVIPGKAVHISERNKMLYAQPKGLGTGNQVGVDALEKALPIIEMLYRKERDWNLNTMRSDIIGSDETGMGAYTITPVAIHGDTYFGSTINDIRLIYGVWYDSKLTVEDIRKEITDDVLAICSTDSWLKEHPPVINMPVIQDWPGFYTDPDHPGVEMMKRASRSVFGKDPVVSGCKYVCDATWIAEHGIPCVVMGAGNGEYGCHGRDEFTMISDLVDTAKIYVAAALDWCN